MIVLSDVTREIAKFDAEIIRLSTHVDINKTVISVSNPQFRILYVPAGAEANAKMELNEVLR